jgi:hypothetical protein
MDFIKNKIFLRGILASLAPITIYAFGYAAASIFTKVPGGFFNPTAWCAILACAFVYPLSQASLWLLFKPIETFIENKIRTDQSYPTKKGNFAPVSQEHSYHLTDIVG